MFDLILHKIIQNIPKIKVFLFQKNLVLLIKDFYDLKLTF